MTTEIENIRLPAFLVETNWLEPVLGSPGLLIFDCAVIAGPNPDPELAKTFPFAFESGQKNFDEGHIFGAGFIDLINDLSDKSSPLPLMSPPEQQFVEAMARYGIGEGTKVVLYSSTEPMWAARVWWLLRAFGFDDAAILNGGLAKWVREGRSLSQEVCTYAPNTFIPSARPTMFADKEKVLGAITDTSACVINALPPPMHSGDGGPVFGRKGRIAGSVNVPNGALHDPDTGEYLPQEKLREIFDLVGVGDASEIITYCGGGIASSNDAFVLTLLGYENVSVYDASMFEWGNDLSLPMETG